MDNYTPLQNENTKVSEVENEEKPLPDIKSEPLPIPETDEKGQIYTFDEALDQIGFGLYQLLLMMACGSGWMVIF